MQSNTALRQGSFLLVVTGFGLVGYGVSFVYSVYFGSGFELGVNALGGVSRADLAVTNPAMLDYMDHLHIGLAGLLIGVGIAIATLAWYGVRQGQAWALGLVALITFLALLTNFQVHFDRAFTYDWLVHLAPSVLATALAIVGVLRAYQGLGSVRVSS